MFIYCCCCYMIVVFIVLISSHQANTTWNWIPWLWTMTGCTSARWAQASGMNRPSGPEKRRWLFWCRRTVHGSHRVIKSIPRKTHRSNWSAYPKVENRRQRLVLKLFTFYLLHIIILRSSLYYYHGNNTIFYIVHSSLFR